MPKRMFAIGLLALAGLTYAETPGWVLVAENADESVRREAKAGTFEVARNKGGEEIAVVTGRSLSGRPNPKINLEKWYVTTRDCAREQGKLVVLTLSGEFKYENDFLKDGGTIASGMAEFICGVHSGIRETRQKKGI